MTIDDDHDRRMRTVTAQGRELGAELRAVRGSLSAAKVAGELGWSPAKLSKLEQGSRGAGHWDVGALLGRCGADKDTRDRIMRLAQEQQVGLFARPHDRGIPDDLVGLVLHERTACAITCYEPMVVPVLLQTQDYARALSRSVVEAPELLDFLVGRRSDRQAVFGGTTSSVFYLNEAALDLVVGDVATMHDQLMRLEFMADWTGVELRLIPRSAVGHAALQHPATLLTFADGASPLVYAQGDCATVFLEADQAVESQAEDGGARRHGTGLAGVPSCLRSACRRVRPRPRGVTPAVAAGGADGGT